MTSRATPRPSRYRLHLRTHRRDSTQESTVPRLSDTLSASSQNASASILLARPFAGLCEPPLSSRNGKNNPTGYAGPIHPESVDRVSRRGRRELEPIERLCPYAWDSRTTCLECQSSNEDGLRSGVRRQPQQCSLSRSDGYKVLRQSVGPSWNRCR